MRIDIGIKKISDRIFSGSDKLRYFQNVLYIPVLLKLVQKRNLLTLFVYLKSAFTKTKFSPYGTSENNNIHK